MVECKEKTDDGPKVLLIAESPSEAAAIRSTLGSDLKRVTICDPARAGAQFDRVSPEVVLFGFRSLQEAERQHDALYRTSEKAWAGEHVDIVLVHRDAVKEAYSLCDSEVFDGYVLYWPQPYDALQLRLSVTQGARYAKLAAQRMQLPVSVADAVHKTSATGSPPPQEEAEEIGHCLREASRSLMGERSLEAGREALKRAERHLVELRRAVDLQSQALEAVGNWVNTLPKRVLVVEDDGFQQQLFTHILEADGFEVQVVATGAEALSAARKAQPHLIVLDYQLPDTDGISLTRKLKSITATDSIPIVMVSGHSNRGVVVESIQAGAADFLVKPVMRDTMRAKVKSRLHLPSVEVLAQPESRRITLPA